MTMKLNALFLLAALTLASPLQAAPQFWDIKNATPTPPQPPDVSSVAQPAEFLTATPTPALAPRVEIPTPTPTPVPGLNPINPTHAALFSVFVPGLGHVYAGDPLKGLVFAAVFGVGLWQTIDNLSLVSDTPGGNTLGTSNNLVAKNETAGNLFGLVTLAAYGFGIQDAYSTAVNYNKNNHLTLSFGIVPRPNASLAYLF